MQDLPAQRHDLRMEQLEPGRLWLAPDSFPLTEDSLMLAEFARVRPGDRVCDLGCGVGTLLVLLARRCRDFEAVGVEADGGQAEIAAYNLKENGIKGTVYPGALQQVSHTLTPGGYDLVISNPPYFAQTRGKTAPGPRGAQRSEVTCTLPEVCRAAARLLKNGGRFAFCARPERLAEWTVCLRELHLEPKRLQLVQSGADKAPGLMLMEAVKGGGTGLLVLPVRIGRKK